MSNLKKMILIGLVVETIAMFIIAFSEPTKIEGELPKIVGKLDANNAVEILTSIKDIR